MVALSGRRTLGYASEQVAPDGCRGAAELRESSSGSDSCRGAVQRGELAGRASGCRGAAGRRESVPGEVRAAVRSAEVVPPSAARSDAREFLRTDVVVLTIVIYALIGVVADSLARLLERRMLAWHPNFGGASR